MPCNVRKQPGFRRRTVADGRYHFARMPYCATRRVVQFIERNLRDPLGMFHDHSVGLDIQNLGIGVVFALDRLDGADRDFGGSACPQSNGRERGKNPWNRISVSHIG